MKRAQFAIRYLVSQQEREQKPDHGHAERNIYFHLPKEEINVTTSTQLHPPLPRKILFMLPARR